MPARRPSASSGGPWAEVGAPCSPLLRGRPDSLNSCWRGDGVLIKLVPLPHLVSSCFIQISSFMVYFGCQTLSKGQVNGHVLLLCMSCMWGKVCVQTDRQRLTGVWQNRNCFNKFRHILYFFISELCSRMKRTFHGRPSGLLLKPTINTFMCWAEWETFGKSPATCARLRDRAR